ncbi:hypothetical protein [Govanella unica]|uniref:Polyphosphate:AMP phosphotransferase n=1 Tax=Govanella unica TaxID=2975056 RepID=A0A9X3Z7T9_9PROT|nr:hypothetical protein [Govania unica]MDA5194506.1 polyphosphate:AMP phosphotransferase [Govania unica]
MAAKRTPSKATSLPTGEALRTSLLDSQFHFSEQQTHGLVIVLAGMLSADIETIINQLNVRMDPRNIRVHALDAQVDQMDRMELKLFPSARRFWMRTPARGTITILIEGWYHFLFDPTRKPPKDLVAKLARRDHSERFLTNERVRVMKVWLDRSKASMKARLHDLDSSKETRWQISDRDRVTLAGYKTYRKRIDPELETSATRCDWTRIDMDAEDTDKTAPTDSLCHAILDALHKPPVPEAGPDLPPLKMAPALLTYRGQYPPEQQPADPEAMILDAQRRIRSLTDSKAFHDRALVVAFEGYDAAGKGGTIRYLVHGIDPRRRNVVPIAAPSSEELLYPYLWRFWKALPAKNDVTIFDRTWYGRVLVERVEGFAKPAEWSRAYGEINDFESEISRHGVILVKIWLDISSAEQSRRFKEREDTPWKNFKITEDDWRNRRKRTSYEKALADMLTYTHTDLAPWTVIPSDNKPVARARTLGLIADRLESALKKD